MRAFFLFMLIFWIKRHPCYARYMHRRQTHSFKPAFTIVELLIVIAVIAILASISIISYNGIQKNAANKVAQSDLDQVGAEMQRYAMKYNGAYPSTLPSDMKTSPNVTLTLKSIGSYNYYGGLNAVQNGELMSQICTDLINEGAGKGKDQGGTTQDYLTGCGNWNQGNMQVTGWDTKKYYTPVTSATLLAYADNFTTNDAYNKTQETVVKNFYHQLVDRQTKQGGSYPITSFWDYWASPQSGGVAFQALPTPQATPTYCVEATHSKFSDIIYHTTETNKILSGSC